MYACVSRGRLRGGDTDAPPLHGLLAAKTLEHGVAAPLAQGRPELPGTVPFVTPPTWGRTREADIT